MRPKFDVCPNIRSPLLNSFLPKLKFGSSHEKFDVWPRPNPDYIRFLGSDRELVCSRGAWLRGGGGKLFLFNSCMSPDSLLVPDHQME